MSLAWARHTHTHTHTHTHHLDCRWSVCGRWLACIWIREQEQAASHLAVQTFDAERRCAAVFMLLLVQKFKQLISFQLQGVEQRCRDTRAISTSRRYCVPTLAPGLQQQWGLGSCALLPAHPAPTLRGACGVLNGRTASPPRVL